MEQALRAPREHGQILAVPPVSEMGSLLEVNRQRLASSVYLLDRSLGDLQQEIRTDVLSLASSYLNDADQSIPDPVSPRFLAAGHQPELFHPGVWIKNFALHGLAKKHGLTPLNLVVDNDTAKSTRLKFPQGEHLVSLPFDHFQGEVPFEERPVMDENLFEDFPHRARSLTNSWPFQPLLFDFWRDLQKEKSRTRLLGERLAVGRRTWERRWGCQNLEVPLSRLCQTSAFARFALALLNDLPRLHEVYNGAVQTYRKKHGIRSGHHPVPDLTKVGDWWEAPFWIWSAGQERRGRLFVRFQPSEMELRLGEYQWVSLPLGARGLAPWMDLEAQGIKIRTRALTTTLFSRLLLADLFLHGIGGGIYDVLTDVLFERFFELPAPRYLVLSATFLLPFPRISITSAEVANLYRLERDLYWNPQRHLSEPSDHGVSLLRERNQCLADEPSSAEEKKERFRALRNLGDRLRPWVDGQRQQVHRDVQIATQDLARKEVQTRRDYSFCLYPEEELRAFLQSALSCKF